MTSHKSEANNHLDNGKGQLHSEVVLHRLPVLIQRRASLIHVVIAVAVVISAILVLIGIILVGVILAGRILESTSVVCILIRTIASI